MPNDPEPRREMIWKRSSMGGSHCRRSLPGAAHPGALGNFLQQPADVEGLFDVAADGWTDLVDRRLSKRRHHDHLRQLLRSIVAQIMHHAISVDPRHHQIEHDDVVVRGSNLLDGLRAIASDVDNKAVGAENPFDQESDSGIVVDYESPAFEAHREPPLNTPLAVHRVGKRAFMVLD